MWFLRSGYGGSFIEADLATGATRNMRTVTECVPLAGSGNRSRVFALIDDSCCPEEDFVYDASTRTIIADGNIVGNYFNWVFGDFAGVSFMVQSSVFGSNLLGWTPHGGNLYTGGPSLLASDGKSGYFATTTGVVHIRFSDGAQLDYFSLAEQPTGM